MTLKIKHYEKGVLTSSQELKESKVLSKKSKLELNLFEAFELMHTQGGTSNAKVRILL